MLVLFQPVAGHFFIDLLLFIHCLTLSLSLVFVSLWKSYTLNLAKIVSEILIQYKMLYFVIIIPFFCSIFYFKFIYLSICFFFSNIAHKNPRNPGNILIERKGKLLAAFFYKIVCVIWNNYAHTPGSQKKKNKFCHPTCIQFEWRFASLPWKFIRMMIISMPNQNSSQEYRKYT